MRPRRIGPGVDVAAKSSRKIVIDASIARAAGGEKASFPDSKLCRDLLKIVLKVCHQLVFTSEISKEWKKHRSTFARQWRVSMEARKKVTRIPESEVSILGEQLEKVAENEKDLEAMIKDLN